MSNATVRAGSVYQVVSTASGSGLSKEGETKH